MPSKIEGMVVNINVARRKRRGYPSAERVKDMLIPGHQHDKLVRTYRERRFQVVR